MQLGAVVVGLNVSALHSIAARSHRCFVLGDQVFAGAESARAARQSAVLTIAAGLCGEPETVNAIDLLTIDLSPTACPARLTSS